VRRGLCWRSEERGVEGDWAFEVGEFGRDLTMRGDEWRGRGSDRGLIGDRGKGHVSLVTMDDRRV
jgi:hypothetical protein